MKKIRMHLLTVVSMQRMYTIFKGWLVDVEFLTHSRVRFQYFCEQRYYDILQKIVFNSFEKSISNLDIAALVQISPERCGIT